MFAPIRQYVQQVQRTYHLHEDPPETPFVYIIHFMCYIGFWPPAEPNARKTAYHPVAGRAYLYYHHCVCACILFMPASILLDLMRAETRSNAILIAEDLTVGGGALMAASKAYRWWRHHAAIVRLFGRMQRRYREQCAASRGWRMQHVRRIYFLQDSAIVAVSAGLMAGMYVAFTLQPFLHNEKSLMYRVVLPWDTTTDAGYRAACVLQFITLTVVFLCILGMEWSGVLVVNQVTMHLHLLRIKWERLGEDRSGALRDEGTFQRYMERRLGELVAEHQMIMGLIGDIHAIFQPIYQMQVCASTCMICTCALSILLTMHDDIVYMLRFLCFMLAAFGQLLFWCWAGERTYDLSMQINGAAYTSNWVDINVRLRRKLVLVLMRSQRALEFTSNPFYVLNYESFSAILSSSCSYFTILRTLLEA